MKAYIAILVALLMIGTVWAGSVGSPKAATSQAVFFVQ
jgi:hypothetical protein